MAPRWRSAGLQAARITCVLAVVTLCVHPLLAQSDSAGDDDGNCPGLGATVPTNLAFVPDLNSRPGINFVARMPNVTAQQFGDSVFLAALHTDVKDIFFQFVNAFSPLITASGFRANCAASVSCLEVLDNPVADGQVSLAMHLVMPWGVPLSVANELAFWIRTAPIMDIPLPSSTDGPAFSEVYGLMSITSTSVQELTTPPTNSTLPSSLELRVITTENLEPFAYKLDGFPNDWVGFVPDFLNRLKDFLPDWINFQYVEVDAKHASDFVDGLINQVSDGGADLVVGPAFITKKRVSKAHFSHAFYDTGEVLVTRTPRPYPPSAQSLYNFMEVFTYDLWAVILLSIVLVACTIWLVETKGAMGEAATDFDDAPGFVRGALDKSMWLSFSTFWGALAPHTPVTFWGRLISMAYTLFILVVVNSYTANLASVLVAQTQLDYPIQSLQEAVTKGAKVCILKGSRADLLAEHDYPGLRVVYIQENSSAAAVSQQNMFQEAILTGFKDVRSGACTGFVVDELMASHALKDGDWCDLTTAGAVFFRGHYAIAMHHNMPISLAAVIDEAVMAMRTNGIINALVARHFVHGDSCPSTAPVPGQYRIIDVLGVIILFVIGLVIGLGCLGMRAFKLRQMGVAPLSEHEPSSPVTGKSKGGRAVAEASMAEPTPMQLTAPARKTGAV